MDDLLVVTVANADEELFDPANRDRRRDGPVAAELRVERLAVEPLEHEERLTAFEAEADDVADVLRAKVFGVYRFATDRPVEVCTAS